MMPRIPDEKIAKAKELLLQGELDGVQIAERLGLVYMSMMHRLKREGFDTSGKLKDLRAKKRQARIINEGKKKKITRTLLEFKAVAENMKLDKDATERLANTYADGLMRLLD